MEGSSETGGQSEAPGGLTPNYNNSLGRPSLYDTYYLRTYQNYLSGDRLPSENHFRNIGSVADHQLRPTLDQIREQDFVKKVSGLTTCHLRRSPLAVVTNMAAAPQNVVTAKLKRYVIKSFPSSWFNRLVTLSNVALSNHDVENSYDRSSNHDVENMSPFFSLILNVKASQ